MNFSIVTIILFVTIIDGFVVNRSKSTMNHRRVVRIANGEQFDQDFYPYVVGLTILTVGEVKFYCTGTLVSPLFVLTAAHCVEGANAIKVYKNNPRNDETGEKREVIELFKHSLYSYAKLVADLCLLKISHPFDSITSYAIISGSPEQFANKTTLKCSILGWGKNEVGYPKHRASVASVWVKYGPDACEVPPNDDYIKRIINNTWKQYLCPVPNTSMVCIGDSGGALMCQGFLFGVASHGYHYHPGMNDSQPKCGDARVQTRHLFIYTYRDWVDGIIQLGTSGTIKFNNRCSMFVLVIIVALCTYRLTL